MKNIVWKGSTEIEVVKQNSLIAMRHHADEQIKKLREHANLLVKQAQELDERVKLAEKIATHLNIPLCKCLLEKFSNKSECLDAMSTLSSSYVTNLSNPCFGITISLCKSAHV